MSRLIDADVLIETFKNTEDSDHCKWSTAGIVDEINSAPTIEVYTKEEVLDMFYMIRNKIWHEPKYFPTYVNHGKSYIEDTFVLHLIQERIDKLRGDNNESDL